MLKEILLLTRLENLNLYGLNKLKYTFDKKEKRRIYLLAGAWIFVMIVLFGYSGGYAYGLHRLGLTHAVPALFSSVVCLVLLVFGLFSSASNLFRKNGYDYLSALPIHPFSIVLSRLIRMYIEDLLLCFAVTLPAIGVYAYFADPAFLFYPAWMIALVFMPMIPLAFSVLLGACISILSSAFKKRALFQALITVAFVVLMIYGSSYLSKMGDEISLEAIRSITELVLKSLEKTYLPAVWIGGIAIGDYAGLLPLIGSGLLTIAVTACLAARLFPFVLLHSGVKSERKAFRAEKSVKSASLMTALIAREFKRYFASGIYLMNTIISPVMAVGMAILFMTDGVTEIVNILPFDLNLPILGAYLIGITCSLMPPSAVALSMEGKNWWLIKTLPIDSRHILGAKIWMSVLLHAPFLLVASVLLTVSLAPDFISGVLMLLIPFALDAFSCTWGLFINTRFARFDWENEVYVVKQSAAAGIGGLSAPLIGIAFALPVAVSGTVLSAVLSVAVICALEWLILKMILRVSLEKL